MKKNKDILKIRLVAFLCIASILSNVAYSQQNFVSNNIQKPKISAEIVVNDGQPKAPQMPKVSGEIVVNDGQPKTSSKPNISGEIVVNDGQPLSNIPTNQINSQVPAIKPFVGEIAVGISLLVTYAPQIIALASSIAVIASTINSIKAQIQGKVPDNSGLAESVNFKLQQAIGLLLGPLSVTNGLAKESIQKLSDYLLDTTKAVNKSFDPNSNEIENQLNESIHMNKELNTLLVKGQEVSKELKALAERYNNDFSNLKTSNQNHEFNSVKQAASSISNKLVIHSDMQHQAFTQSLAHAETSLKILQNIKSNISSENLSKAAISKSLIDARKNILYSYKVIDEADPTKQGIHLQIIQILTDAKNELENYAKELGISQEVLSSKIRNTTQNQNLIKVSNSNNFSSEPVNKDIKVYNSIDQMIDKYSNITKSQKSIRIGNTKENTNYKYESNKAVSSSNNASFNTKISQYQSSDELYQKMVQAYKEYIRILTTDPTNQKAIAEARVKYEKAQRAYQSNY